VNELPGIGLLHVSDLHFGDPPDRVSVVEILASPLRELCQTAMMGTHDSAASLALARWTAEHVNRFDAIVATGDLATTGRDKDLNQARALFDRSAAATLGAFTHADSSPSIQRATSSLRPIALIPGNHDRYGHRYGPGNPRFDRKMGLLGAPVFPLVGRRVATLMEIGREAGTTLIVIGADLTLREGDTGNIPFGYLGCGRASVDIMEDLAAETRWIRTTHRPTFVVWAVHFPPGAPRTLELVDGQRLLEYAAMSGVRPDAILCGHTHAAGNTATSGIPVITCSTTTQASRNETRELQIIRFIESEAPPTIERWAYDPQSLFTRVT
jgi:predicted phosphodiesterase